MITAKIPVTLHRRCLDCEKKKVNDFLSASCSGPIHIPRHSLDDDEASMCSEQGRRSSL